MPSIKEMSIAPKPSWERLILLADFPDYYFPNEMKGTSELQQCNAENPFGHPIKCFATFDKKLINQSDAVIFYSHGKNKLRDIDFLPVKLNGQTWTMFSVESPAYSKNAAFGDPVFHRKFNSTMTYRTDSEFWHGYIRTIKREIPWTETRRNIEEAALRKSFRNKTRMAAIFISHCNTPSNRHRYIHQLKMYMDLDVYGLCGDLKCEDRVKCDQMLSYDYKFYLAFENSICVDYVTEKLLRVLKSGRVVPIVRGGANYGKLFPRNSVIDTSLFFSAYELAHHVNQLGQDEDEWVKMFNWRSNWEVSEPYLPMCQYCYHLYKHQRSWHLYDNVYAWWNKDACFRPVDL
ncbi:hypothetical protein EGW08_008970 [Elysia chlorotica]|uniref:Fucosyltransferase n=1 Tax=Elysia chlorotica TaxID=188477 RepID=A0A3S1C587_ELYCH|nr:hypothetical protein EGW08_008970 [Elysia chlorotica]